VECPPKSPKVLGIRPRKQKLSDPPLYGIILGVRQGSESIRWLADHAILDRKSLRTGLARNLNSPSGQTPVSQAHAKGFRDQLTLCMSRLVRVVLHEAAIS
jgi:hypothetical protein